MLITTEPDWARHAEANGGVAGWPGPICLALMPGEKVRPTASQPGLQSDGAAPVDLRVFDYAQQTTSVLRILRDVVLVMERFRQFEPGPFLFTREGPSHPEIQTLRARADEAFYAAEWTIDPVTGEPSTLFLGAEVAGNPLFIPFFKNLQAPEAQNPDEVLSQLRFHLVPWDLDETSAQEEAAP